MPTFELLGKGTNGRVDMLKLTALTKADAVAEANRIGFTISDVREIEELPGPKDHATRHIQALELIANSRLVRKPVWTICWGICLASLIIGTLYWVATIPERHRLAEEQQREFERQQQEIRGSFYNR